MFCTLDGNGGDGSSAGMLGGLTYAALAAFITHLFCSHFEPWPQHLCLPAIVALALVFRCEYVCSGHDFLPAVLSTTGITSLYLAVLLASIAVYRLYFHRLARFPGPPSLALSKWTMLLDDIIGRRYRRIDTLHASLGPVVRTGPREVSINDANAIPAIYGAQSPCIKGPWYRGIAGDRPTSEQSVYDTIDKHVHARRRRGWNAALSHSSRIAHFSAISKLVNKTMDQLAKKTKSSSVADAYGSQASQTSTHVGHRMEADIGEWCTMFSFDVMGVIGFSRSFNLVERGSRSRELRLLQEAVANAQVIGNLPYLSKALDWLPSNHISLFKAWVRDAISARARVIRGGKACDEDVRSPFGSAPPMSEKDLEYASQPASPTSFNEDAQQFDVMGHLLRTQDAAMEIRNGKNRETEKQIIAEGMLLAVGGSDTTSAALTMALYLLSTHGDVAEEVRKEVKQALADAKLGVPDTNDDMVREADILKEACPLLNAVIKETLRLYPPGLSGLQRQTPREGLALYVRGKPVWVPGNVVVTTPTWTIQRDACNFSPHPHAFRPERWLRPQKEDHMNPAAFTPFGYGPTSCAGRELAWVEMRLFLSKMLQTFDLSLAPGFDIDAFEHGVRDLFTLHVKVPLRLSLTLRA